MTSPSPSRLALQSDLLPAGMLILAAILSPAIAFADAGPFEPTVEPKEAAALVQASAIAATNPAAAVAFLDKQNRRTWGPATHFALGNFYFQQEDYVQSEKAYLAALLALPNFRSAKANLGRVYLLQNQPAKTIELFQSLVRDGQGDINVLLLLGHSLLLQNHASSAETAYRQTLLLSPGHRDAMLGLCKCLLIQDRPKEALSLLKEMISFGDIRQELWSLRANAHLALDQPGEALISLDCARRLGVAGPGMLATLGDLYLNRQQPDEALQSYDLAFASTNMPADHLLRAAEGFLSVSEPAHASRLLDKLSSLTDAHPDLLSRDQKRQAMRLNADMARIRGDTSRARDAYRKLLFEDPLDARALLSFGDLQRDTGKPEEAVMAYERAARVSGFESRALIRQAQVEIERERYKKALELLEAALAFDDQPHLRKYVEQVRRLAAIDTH